MGDTWLQIRSVDEKRDVKRCVVDAENLWRYQ